MARPLKQGLDYFSLDVDFFHDDKIRIIMKAQGTKAIPVILCLLARIYRENGYWMQWEQKKLPLLVADEVCTDVGVVSEVLATSVDIGFFDSAIYKKFGVLTSRGIQKRYFTACGKRTQLQIEENFLLVDPAEFLKKAVLENATTMPKNVFTEKTGVFSEKTIVNSKKSTQRESKEKVKRKESKEKEKENSSAAIPASVLDAYQRGIRPICNEMEQTKLADDVAKYGEDTVIKAIERAVVRGKRSIGYIEGILQRWEENGYDEQAPPRSQTAKQENPQLAIARRAIEMLRGEKARNE